MDLGKLEATDEGKRLTLLNPTTGEELCYEIEDGVETPMFLTMVSLDSSIYKKSQRRIIDRRLKQQSKFRSAKLNAAQLEEETLFTLADCTTGGALYADGEEVIVTPGADALKLYKRFPWIKEQASEFMEDRSNFLDG